MSSSIEKNGPNEPVVELVPPMDRDTLLELDHEDRHDSEVYVYLHPEENEVYVNAEPKNLELGLPFWLKVLKPEKVKDVEAHPYYYAPGQVAVRAAILASTQAA